MLYSQEDFDPKENRFSEGPLPSAPICSSNVFKPLFCSTRRKFWIKKEADYILYMSVIIFFSYTTHPVAETRPRQMRVEATVVTNMVELDQMVATDMPSKGLDVQSLWQAKPL